MEPQENNFLLSEHLGIYIIRNCKDNMQSVVIYDRIQKQLNYESYGKLVLWKIRSQILMLFPLSGLVLCCPVSLPAKPGPDQAHHPAGPYQHGGLHRGHRAGPQRRQRGHGHHPHRGPPPGGGRQEGLRPPPPPGEQEEAGQEGERETVMVISVEESYPQQFLK